MNFEWLSGVPPAAGAIAHALAWLALVVWACSRPPAEIFEGAPDGAWWRDLRLWVLPLAGAQVALYFLFR